MISDHLCPDRLQRAVSIHSAGQNTLLHAMLGLFSSELQSIVNYMQQDTLI